MLKCILFTLYTIIYTNYLEFIEGIKNFERVIYSEYGTNRKKSFYNEKK